MMIILGGQYTKGTHVKPLLLVERWNGSLKTDRRVWDFQKAYHGVSFWGSQQYGDGDMSKWVYISLVVFIFVTYMVMLRLCVQGVAV